MALAFLLGLIAACGAPGATAPTLPAPPAGVQALLDWLTERTATCLEDRLATVGHRGWTCTVDMAEADPTNATDRTVYTTQIVATGDAITSITATVDLHLNASPWPPSVCGEATCGPASLGFFGDTIALAPPTGDLGDTIARWVETHIQFGGTAKFGSILVRLSPLGVVSTFVLEFEPGS